MAYKEQKRKLILSLITIMGIILFSLMASALVVDSVASREIGVATLSNKEFAIAYVSENNISYSVYNTNGTLLVPKTIIATNVGVNSRVQARAINSTAFIVSWYASPSNLNLNYKIFSRTGQNISSNQSMGVIGTANDQVDISIAPDLNKAYIGYLSDATTDADLRNFTYSALGGGTEIIIDGTLTASQPMFQYVSATIINSTRLGYWYNDDADNDATFVLVNTATNGIISSSDRDTNMGNGQIRATSMYSNLTAGIWYDQSDSNIYFEILNRDGGDVYSATSQDNNAGANSRVAITTARRTDNNQSVFVIGWNDRNSDSIEARVLSHNGTLIHSYTLATDEQTTNLFFALQGRNDYLNAGICNGTYIFAYTNTTGSIIAKQLLINGTEADGNCGDDFINPNATLLQPINNLYTNITGVNFTINATDNVGLSNITLYIYNGTALVTQQTQTVSGKGGIFGIFYNFLFNDVFTWFYRVIDTAGNIFTTGNRTIIVDTIYPQLAITYPVDATNYDFVISNITHSVNETNLANCTFSNGTITTNITCNAPYYFNASENTNTWVITATDLAGQSYAKSTTFLVDTIYPQISYGENTPLNSSTVLGTSLFVNVSVIESNFYSINYKLYNSTGTYSDVTLFTPLLSVQYTNLAQGNYTFEVTIADVVNHINSTELRTITMFNPIVNITILNPRRPRYDFNSTLNSILIYDSLEALNSSYFVWGYPNGSTITLQGRDGKTSDDFSNSSLWTIENTTIGVSQTCIANISDGKANLLLTGDGTPVESPRCALKDQTVIENFDITLDYNITQLENNSAIEWIMSDSESTDSMQRYVLISMGNWVGYPRGIDVFVDDGNIGGYIVNSYPSNQTEGKFRITRFEDNFTFYNHNGTDFEMLTSIVLSGMRLYQNQYLSVTNALTYGNVSATFDNLNVTTDHIYRFTTFNDTSEEGYYNVTAYATNVLGYSGVSNTRITYIGSYNYPPSVPILNHPEPLDTYSREMEISWTPVFDQNGDSFRFNITLLDQEGNYLQDIVADYGDISTDSYDWNIPDLADGNYSLSITVYENETIEGYPRTYTLIPFYFFIDQTPPSLTIESPLSTNYTNATLLINITSNGFTVWYNINGSNITYTSPIYVEFPQGTTNFTACANEQIGLEEEYGNEICVSELIFVDSLAPIISYISPTDIANVTKPLNNIKVNVNVTESNLANITIRLYNSTLSEIANSIGFVAPHFVEFVNLSNGIYYFNATACDNLNFCSNAETRKVTINQGMLGGLELSLIVPQYPYVDINVTYPLNVQLNFGDITVTDAIVNFTLNLPDGTNISAIMPYNSTSGYYGLSLIFDEVGNFPFTITANSSSFGYTSESGTFIARVPFYLTIKLFEQGTLDPIENDFAYITAEYVGTRQIDDLIEPFIYPIADNRFVARSFHAPYINGEAYLKLYEPQTDYVFRYFDGIVTFDGEYSAPNVTKSYGTEVYLGTQYVNGTDSLYQFVLSEKDLKPYFWLFNWVLIILLVLVGVGSLAMFFFFPDKPQIALVFGVLFTLVLIGIRVAVYLWMGQ